MTRLTEIEHILFKVEEYPVFAQLPGEENPKWVHAPGKKAVVDMWSKRVVGVVGKDYRVVPNLDAILWGYQACLQAFPETDIVEWNLGKVDGPSTGTRCSIDILHSTAKLDFSFVEAGNKPESYGPFIRVTNSYNCMRALSFEIGFFRKVCGNGLILPQAVILFRFNHLKSEIGAQIDFDVSSGAFLKMRQSFLESLDVLTGYQVAEDDFELLARSALGIRPPLNVEENRRTQEDWQALSSCFSALCDHYYRDLGGNAYAILNAVTDFASHPPNNRLLRRDRHSLQKKAGSWASEFSRRCVMPEFSVSSYLGEQE